MQIDEGLSKWGLVIDKMFYEFDKRGKEEKERQLIYGKIIVMK